MKLVLIKISLIKIFLPIKKTIEDECSLFLTHTLNIGDFYQNLKITNSWANKTEPGKTS